MKLNITTEEPSFNEKYYLDKDDPVGIFRLRETGEPVNIVDIPDDEIPESLKTLKKIMLEKQKKSN